MTIKLNSFDKISLVHDVIFLIRDFSMNFMLSAGRTMQMTTVWWHMNEYVDEMTGINSCECSMWWKCNKYLFTHFHSIFDALRIPHTQHTVSPGQCSFHSLNACKSHCCILGAWGSELCCCTKYSRKTKCKIKKNENSANFLQRAEWNFCTFSQKDIRLSGLTYTNDILYTQFVDSLTFHHDSCDFYFIFPRFFGFFFCCCRCPNESHAAQSIDFIFRVIATQFILYDIEHVIVASAKNIQCPDE